MLNPCEANKDRPEILDSLLYCSVKLIVKTNKPWARGPKTWTPFSTPMSTIPFKPEVSTAPIFFLTTMPFFVLNYVPLLASVRIQISIFPPFHFFFSQSSSSLVYFPKFNFADDPFGDPKATGDPYCTLFVGRLSRLTTEDTLRKVTFLGLSIFISHVRISNRKIVLYKQHNYGENCLWFIILIQFNSVHVTKVMFQLME